MGDRRFAWFVAGFFAAVLLSALVDSARAQGAAQPTTSASPSGPAGQTRTPPSQDSLEEAPAAPDIAPPQLGDDLADADADQNQDGLEPVPRLDQRTLPVDGDLTGDQEPQVLKDGNIEVGEPPAVQDGGDAGRIDTRPAEDIALFDYGAAGPASDDPLLFQIEDIDPVRNDRLPARLASLDPYDPVGIRIGSFVLFPEVELGGFATSNVLRSPDASSDIAAEVMPAARFVSNWSRHALEFRGAGDFSFFDDFDSENDKSYTLEARGRLDVTRRTNVQALISHDRQLESRSAINAVAIGTRTPIDTERAEAALNHRFNRLSVQIRGSVADYSYGDTENLGATTSNSDRNYDETAETVRATWEFKPTLSAFSEVSINQRDYDQAAQSDLINRTSNGQRYRFGVGFGNTSRILRGEISLGYGRQAPEDDRLHDIDGLIIDANATWRMTELTSLLFVAQSDVTETNIANVAGALSRSGGLELRHAFRRYLIASAGLAYSTQDSQDGVIDDKELRSTLGLEYYVNPEVVLYGRYAHINFDGIGDSSDYIADEMRVGVRLRR